MKAVRTTVTLDEDVYGAARSIAAVKSISIGSALSELARKGLRRRPPRATRSDRGIPVFEVPGDAPPLTAEMVATALEDEPE
jgi:hypothetical protein